MKYLSIYGFNALTNHWFICYYDSRFDKAIYTELESFYALTFTLWEHSFRKDIKTEPEFDEVLETVQVLYYEN